MPLAWWMLFLFDEAPVAHVKGFSVVRLCSAPQPAGLCKTVHWEEYHVFISEACWAERGFVVTQVVSGRDKSRSLYLSSSLVL